MLSDSECADVGRERLGVVYLVFGGTHLINTTWNLSQVGSGELPGIVFLSRYVKGSLPVEVDFRNSGEATGDLTLNVDLKNAILEIPLFGWVKPLGMDGTGRISFALEKGRITNIRNFNLKTEDFLARGSARMAPDGTSLAAAEIDRLAFAANDFKATFPGTTGPRGSFTCRIPSWSSRRSPPSRRASMPRTQ